MGSGASSFTFLPYSAANIEPRNFGESVVCISRKMTNLINLNKGSIYSPLSIAYALSLVKLGATGNTNTELGNILGFDATIENLHNAHITFNNNIMSLTNYIVINDNYTLHKSYIDTTKDICLLSTEDFTDAITIANKINKYITEKTHNCIKNIIEASHINTDTQMLLINIVYFKTMWKSPFKKYNTVDKPFNDIHTVKMMNKTYEVAYYEDLFVQIIKLPYKTPNVNMVFVLPKSRSDINIDRCTNYIGCDEFTEQKCCISIPKFTQRSNMNLVSSLKQLGVNSLFSEDCELDDMGKDLVVSNIFHEAYIKVNEDGTEAAAVTGVTFENKCACIDLTKPIIFNADHTFFYYIEYRSVPIFIGVYEGQ